MREVSDKLAQKWQDGCHLVWQYTFRMFWILFEGYIWRRCLPWLQNKPLPINRTQTDGFICPVSLVVISRYLNQVVLIHTSKLYKFFKFMPPNTRCLEMSEEPASSFCFSSGVNILNLTEQKLSKWSSKHIFSAKRDRKILIHPIKLRSQLIFQTQY